MAAAVGEGPTKVHVTAGVVASARLQWHDRYGNAVATPAVDQVRVRVSAASDDAGDGVSIAGSAASSPCKVRVPHGPQRQPLLCCWRR